MATAAPAASPGQPIIRASLEQQLKRARGAQADWSRVAIPERLALFREFRHLLACQARNLTELVSPELARSRADTLVSEVLPLAEAVRYLELEAHKLLASTKVPKRGRPLWLSGVDLSVQRDPWGVVLVIGPANYPLLLPGVQTVQALVAGNAVFWKPGRGGSPLAQAIADLLRTAGLPEGLLNITAESSEAAHELLHAGVDKVVMTGSESSGRAVLSVTADRVIPTTVELSGCDAMFVLSDANVSRSVDALLFGLRLNGSGTCIAPRRIFLSSECAKSFKRELIAKLESVPPVPVSARTFTLVQSLISDAVDRGATLLTQAPHSSSLLGPVILDDVTPQMQAMRADVFAPVASLLVFKTEAEALASAGACPYALGATVFGGTGTASRFAQRISAGVVVVNDMIVPTADPRISFGGRGASGFGKTRGAEGLLEMTVSKTVAFQRSGRLRHLEPPHPQAVELFSHLIASVHGRGLQFRLKSMAGLLRTLRRKSGLHS